MSPSKQFSQKDSHKAQPGTGGLSPSNFGLLAGAAMIVVATILIYIPSLNGSFIWDDNDIYITQNQGIKASDGLYRFWFTTQAAEYYPVSNSTFWIEWRLWGMNPIGYHATNLILHIVGAC